jgi:hypothetical protein
MDNISVDEAFRAKKARLQDRYDAVAEAVKSVGIDPAEFFAREEAQRWARFSTPSAPFEGFAVAEKHAAYWESLGVDVQQAIPSSPSLLESALQLASRIKNAN